MVAAYVQRGSLPDTRNHLIGACAIAHDIAKVPYGIAHARGLQDRLECFKIAVNVREDERAHKQASAQLRNLPMLSKIHELR